MSFSSISSFSASSTGRAWQGCATDGASVWLISDRTTSTAPHTLSNNIDTFDRDGNLLATDTAIYAGVTPVGGLMWSFVDGEYDESDGYLHIVCTDYHSNGYVESECQMLILDPSDWSIVDEIALTTHAGSIESPAKRGSEWWICWSGSQSIRRYNSTLTTILGTYSVPTPSGFTLIGDGTIKWGNGLAWHGDVLFLCYHGSNNLGETYAPGISESWWNGSSFQEIRGHAAPTYGAGQGMCRVSGTNEFWFNDRPNNTLVKCTCDNPGVWTFNGSTGGINAGSASAIDDLTLGAFTVAAWITPTSTGEGGTGRIADKRNNMGAEGGWLFFTDGTASLGFQTISSASAALANSRGSANQITLGVRQHVIAAYDNAGDRKAHIYVGNVEISYGTQTAASGTSGSDSGGDLLIGTEYANARVFDGTEEFIAIWNSYLSSDNRALLAAGAHPESITPAPVFHGPALDFPAITANASITQASNTSAGASTLAIAADSSQTQAGNTVSATASLVAETITADASITQASNTASSDSVLSIAADLSVTQAGDSSTATSSLAIAADCSVTQAGDTVSSTAALASDTITANASITQDGNTSTSVGVLSIDAESFVTQAGNTLYGVAVLVSDIVADASITQASNTSSASCVITIDALASITQTGNTLSATGGLVGSWSGEIVNLYSPIAKKINLRSYI